VDVWAYFRFTAISVLIGLAAFSLSYAGWVWRRRRSGAADRAPTTMASVVRVWSTGMVIAGIVAAVAVMAVREVIPHKGLMTLDDAVAVRSRRDATLESLASPGTVRAGDAIARFRSPAWDAEAAMLAAKIERLEARQQSLALQPLEIDAELTRRHQSVLNRTEQLGLAYYNLLPELKGTVRTGLERRLERSDKSVSLDTDVIRHEQLIRQAESELDFTLKELARVEKLVTVGARSESDLQDAKREVEVAEAEMVKLRRGLEQFRREQKQLATGAREFDQMVDEHATALAAEIDTISTDLACSRESLKVLERKLEEDAARARGLRAAEERQLVLEMRETQAELDGVRRSMIVVAPFDGHVIYRNSAPDSIEEHGVMMVVARDRGAKVEFIAPAFDSASAERREPVDVWIEGSAFATRLSGELIEATPSPFEADQVLVSLRCQPPTDLIARLANEQSTRVRISWRPPLLSIPAFQIGMALIAGGMLGWGAALARGKSSSRTATMSLDEDAHEDSQQEVATTESESAHAVETVPSPSPVPAPAFASRTAAGRVGLEYGSTGTMLAMLGSRLREGVLRGDVDRELIDSVEWSLDRHQGRAVKLIRNGLLGGGDDSTDARAALLTGVAAIERDRDDAATIAPRLRRIFETLRVADLAVASHESRAGRPRETVT